ncbi:MAG: nucleotide sugar dehydrogenase [Candidatus Promineifilaceae bacterium]|nr:nucleotide sugar dehydrogenase [Candidatus Promineifilaceae bacterium]
MLDDLCRRIEEKSARVAVIGLGYVGLPVAAEFARVGYDVLGVDIQGERVARINRGESPIEGDEPGLDTLIADVVGAGRLRATTDYAELGSRDVILIAVETPVDEQQVPRYQALRAVLADLAPVLKAGALVIVESTIAPRTMRDLVQPALEGGSGYRVGEQLFLGHCPERVMPGRLLHNLRTLSRVVGGMTPETAEAMVVLYRTVTEGALDATDCLTAELVKTAENAYRDVQIAFANEVAMICEAVGGDVWAVRELVNKSPGRQMLLPGAGVGGHCIPKDPWLLAYAGRSAAARTAGEADLRLIPAARAVNDGMPGHMLALLERALAEAGRTLDGACVLVMGYAYLEDSDDTRNSPSAALVGQLERAGVEVRIHDPCVAGYQGDLLALAEGCDAAVVMVRHHAYREVDLGRLRGALRLPILVDGRRVFERAAAAEAGLRYIRLGDGRSVDGRG